MASQLMRGLQKFLAPVLRRGQHDYFPRTMKLHNGEKSKQVYSAQEMERRLNSIRSHMEKDGVDACVFTSYYNIYYFSDFLFCSFGRPYAFIVTDEKTISVTPSVDYGHPWRRTSGENISYTNWNKDNFYYAIQQQVQSASTVGFEFPEMGVNALKSFSEVLPQAKFVDVAEQAMEIRRTKSPEELDVIRKGSKIAELGGYAAIKAIHEGVPEYEVALAATSTIVREIAAEFPQTDIRDSWAWFQSGVNTDGAHDFPTTRRVQKGDILSLNCFPMIAGNYTALERTLFYDHASERHMEIWEINNKVHRRGLEITKPGVRCSDVARELNEIYREHDLLQYRTIGYGHSTGVMCHYFGRDWGLEFLEHVDTVLEPGMVITMEPMIVVPEDQPGAGGYREHDTMIITETGIENTTASFPIGPSQNIIKN